MIEIKCKSCGKSAGHIEIRNKKICTRIYTGNNTLFTIFESTNNIFFHCPNVKCTEYGKPQKVEIKKAIDNGYGCGIMAEN